MAISVSWNGNGRQYTANNASDTVVVVKYAGAGGAPSSAAADGSIEGSTAITVQVSKQGIALFVALPSALDFTSTESGQLIYVWGNFLAASLLNSQAANGFGICLSSGTPTTSNYSLYSFYGSDNYSGGWVRMVLDPNETRSGGAGTLSLSNITHIGVFADVGGTTARFDNLILDACDVGTGLTITGTTTGDTLFSEILTNEATNRYGVVRSLNDDGTAIELLGKLVLGDTAGASTLSDVDSKIFAGNPKYYDAGETTSIPLTSFGVEVVGGASANSLSLGKAVGSTGGRNGIALVGNDTYNVGFDFSDGNVNTGNYYGCSFENLNGTLSFDSSSHNFKGNSISSCGSFSFVTGSTVSECAFVASGQIVLSGNAALSDCVITNSTATSAVSTNSLNNLTACTFTSSGTGHAVNLGSVTSSTTMNWNNNDSNYASTDGITGNETILVNVSSGQTLTINVGSGYSTPTVKNDGGGSVSVSAGQVTTTITVKDVNTQTAIQNARVYLKADAGGPLSAGTVIINALTDSNGQVSDIRSLASNQPVTGYARKASASPLYKNAPITGTINNGTGLSITTLMIPDE